MAKKLKGDIEQLKTVVEMTGASGEWQDKGNGHWQFRCNDHAILNWWQSSGTISYQGPQTEKQEFEQIVDLAIAKLFAAGGTTPGPPRAEGAGTGTTASSANAARPLSALQGERVRGDRRRPP